MGAPPELLETIEDGIAKLTFNRPERLNALSTPIMQGLLDGLPGQFVAQLLEQSLHALRFDGLERDSVHSRGPIVLFGHRIRCVQGLHLADVDV
jgi:hypothetical protein